MKRKYIREYDKIPLALVIGESTGLESFKKILLIWGKIITIKYVISSSDAYNNRIKKICKEKGVMFFSRKQFKKKNKEILNLNKKIKILLSIFSSIILNKSFLKSLEYRCYNFHPGILPFYPGKNCVSGAIYNFERQTGVTIHKMSNQIDGGKILFQKKIRINKDDTLFSVMNKLKKINLILLTKILLHIKYKKRFKFKKNNKKRIKTYPKTVPNSGLINNGVSFYQFKRMFNAGFSGPFKNEWGNLYIIYKNKKKIIYSYKTIKNLNIKKIIKKDKETYDIPLKDIVLRVITEC